MPCVDQNLYIFIVSRARELLKNESKPYRVVASRHPHRFGYWPAFGRSKDLRRLGGIRRDGRPGINQNRPAHDTGQGARIPSLPPQEPSRSEQNLLLIGFQFSLQGRPST